MSFDKHNIFGTSFEVTTRYVDLAPIGMGAFGLVCSAKDTITQSSVAVKKIVKPFAELVLAKRTYRELKLLKHLRHDNIIGLSDVFIAPSEDIYIITELLGTDLHRLLTSRRLEKQFIQYFLYQILRALKYVHSAGVVHRDLKPSNILINENCDLKICDFGLARVQDSQMTGYVSTRYYRAPEIMLTWQQYDTAVDVWSAGCIFAEMLDGRPLFPGRDHVHQFTLITELLGTPQEDVIRTISSENTLRFVRNLPHREPVPFSRRFSTKDSTALDLLARMLVFNPRARASAASALAHAYVSAYHEPLDEPRADAPFDWSFNEAHLPVDTWRVMMYSEIVDFHQGGSDEAGLAQWLGALTADDPSTSPPSSTSAPAPVPVPATAPPAAAAAAAPAPTPLPPGTSPASLAMPMPNGLPHGHAASSGSSAGSSSAASRIHGPTMPYALYPFAYGDGSAGAPYPDPSGGADQLFVHAAPHAFAEATYATPPSVSAAEHARASASPVLARWSQHATI